jgi:hypothetical protein
VSPNAEAGKIYQQGEVNDEGWGWGGALASGERTIPGEVVCVCVVVVVCVARAHM